MTRTGLREKLEAIWIERNGLGTDACSTCRPPTICAWHGAMIDDQLHLIDEWTAGVIGKDYPTDSQVTSANLAAEQRNDEHAIQRRRAGIGENNA